MNKYASTFVFIAILLTPWAVSAKEGWRLVEGENRLVLKGACAGKEVGISLFSKETGVEAYSTTAVCKDGSFEFTDYLPQWPGMKDGSYALVVNKDERNEKTVTVERTVPSDPVISTDTGKDDTVVLESPILRSESGFLDAFVALQQSLLDMRLRLAESEYPEIVKASLDAAIDGIDKIAGSMTDLLFASETGEDAAVAETAEETAIADEGAAADPVAIHDVSDASVTVGSTELPDGMSEGNAADLLLSDGLSISEGAVAGSSVENGQ
ncbi:MAG TPA: hypothetical protein VN420_05110 [Candidatus Fimivivens sp.]|nr:hypothetical protein [Candidatus Fimivivens sp.]